MGDPRPARASVSALQPGHALVFASRAAVVAGAVPVSLPNRRGGAGPAAVAPPAEGGGGGGGAVSGTVGLL